MTDFLSKFSISQKIIRPYLTVINSIQNSNPEINLLTINNIKKTENIIPSTDSLHIGSSEYRFRSLYLSDNINSPTITSDDILTLQGNSVNLSANRVDMSGSINFKENVYFNGYINIFKPVYFRTREKVSILNENQGAVLSISDSGKLYIVDSTDHNQYIQINIPDNVIDVYWMSVNDSVGFTFNVYFNVNASSDIAYTIGFNDSRTIVGFVENYGDKTLKIVNTNFGIRIKDYKIGDSISFIYTGEEWIVSGNVLDVDNITMRTNAFSHSNGND